MAKEIPGTPAIIAAIINVPYGGTSGSMRPLGPAFVVAYARSKGHLVDAFDFSDSNSTPSSLVLKYNLASYHIVALSFYNQNALIAYAIASEIKRISPKTIVIAGGPHASACDQRMLDRHPEIDIVIRNEGEETFDELLTAYKKGLPLAGIQGTSVRLPAASNSTHTQPCIAEYSPVIQQKATAVLEKQSSQEATSDRIVRALDRPRISDLDSLPAPIVDFLGESDNPAMIFPVGPGRARRATAMVTSRSCPYSCKFCAIISIGRQWRAATPGKVISDFLALDAQQSGTIEHIYFLDANFFVNPQRAVEIARLLQKCKPGISFSFPTRVNQIIRNEAVICDLAGLGLAMVELGIESASPEALERFGKGVTPEENDLALQVLAKNGVKLGLDFIMFDAECSINDLEKNLAFFQRNNLDLHVPWESYFNYMTPYLATEIRLRYEELAGYQFDDDILPDPSSLIQDPQVQLVFDEFHRLCKDVPIMLQKLESIETASLDETLAPQARARMRLNAASLRRFYYVTLRNLIALARTNRPIVLQDALPVATLDDGSLITWQNFISNLSMGLA
jgi:radical SAM superfamily enzyme YgiQ (UPF0313 family)